MNEKKLQPDFSFGITTPTDLFWVFDRNRDVKLVLQLLFFFFVFFFQLQHILNMNLISLSRHTVPRERIKEMW